MKKCVLFILAFCVLASSSFFGKSILNVMAGEKEIEPRYYKSRYLSKYHHQKRTYTNSEEYHSENLRTLVTRHGFKAEDIEEIFMTPTYDERDKFSWDGYARSV